jgi:signal transduction histidine kinase
VIIVVWIEAGMTIKKRLFFSNIRMVLVTIGGFFVAFLAVRIIIFAMMGGIWWDNAENNSDFAQYKTRGWGSLLFLVYATIFVLFICIINSILTYRMTKNITKPLEILSIGVKQIHENNFAYRIEYDDDNEFRPVCDAFNQMAAQLQASAEMRAKDEANRRELLAGISHDLRTPLTTIKGYLEGIETGVASTPQMREKYFFAIKNKTDSMEHIIEQLFLFSKLDMDEFPLLPRHVDITRVITDMIDELAEEYTNRGLIITIVNNLQSIFVSIDTMFFRNALINILENSVTYKTKKTGHLEMSVSLDRAAAPLGLQSVASTEFTDFVILKFADDGPGVNPDTLPHLFNAFYRADPSRHTKGSGLGLAISAKIIERSGGTIHAENDDPGGLAIIIRLPIYKKAD